MSEAIPAKHPEPISDMSDEDSSSVHPSNVSEHNTSHAAGRKTPNSEEKDVDDLSFPERLMSILQSGTVDHALKWVANGEAVAIMTKAFEEAVLEGHFHGSKYSSFTRKLNRWGFKRYSGGPSMPQGWVVFRHGLFSQNRPELAHKMCTGKNRHFVLNEAKAQAKTNIACQGMVAPRHAAAAAASASATVVQNGGDFFANTGVMHRQFHSDSFGLASMSGNQLQAVQLIQMQLDEAIKIERMKHQQRLRDAEIARVRLQGHPSASSLLQRDFLTPMETATSRLVALQQQAAEMPGASRFYSATGTAPRLYESLLLERQAAQARTSCPSSLPQLYEFDSSLVGSHGNALEEYRFLALRERFTARETKLRQLLQEKEALLLNQRSREGGTGSTSSAVPQEVNFKAGRSLITEAERQRLLRLREQLDYVIGP